jgi:hypothetical protein
MPADPRAIESLLAFWAEAGVDVAYADAPVDRMALGLEALKPKPAVVPSLAPSGATRPTLVRDTADPGAVAAARDAAAAAGDLAQLAAAIAAFDGCELKRQGARQAVFARGASDAPVMVIGEGPGADEDAQGEPFVGRAGKLLDRMLAAAGLSGRVFITNTVFWRPPGNRTPTAAEQAACAPFVERAIALVRPRLLLLASGPRPSTCCRPPMGSYRFGAAGSSGDRPTAGSNCPLCRHCIRPSCSGSRRRRRRPGRIC